MRIHKIQQNPMDLPKNQRAAATATPYEGDGEEAKKGKFFNVSVISLERNRMVYSIQAK